MLTRRDRNRKTKKTTATFAYLILPLIVVLDLALLFFSVKLFFLDSSPQRDMETQNNLRTQSQDEALNESHDYDYSLSDDAMNSTQDETPKAPSKKVKKKIKQTDSKESKNTEKAAAVSNDKTSKTDGTKTTEGVRFDVQIGGFAVKEGANTIFEKARALGYEVYISEGTLSDKPFYRVRVVGSSSQQDAIKLSEKLKKQGYPVYIIKSGKEPQKGR